MEARLRLMLLRSCHGRWILCDYRNSPYRPFQIRHLIMRYCGRDFSRRELEQIRHLIAENPDFHRAELSRQLCRILQWLKPDGGLKQMSARVAMLRMREDGLIQLPPACRAKAKVKPFMPTAATDPQDTVTQPVHHLPPLKLQLVDHSNSRCNYSAPLGFVLWQGARSAESVAYALICEDSSIAATPPEGKRRGC